MTWSGCIWCCVIVPCIPLFVASFKYCVQQFTTAYLVILFVTKMHHNILNGVFLPYVSLLTFGVYLYVHRFYVAIIVWTVLLTWISLTYLLFYLWKWIRYNATLYDLESFVVGLECNCVIFVLVCCYNRICNALCYQLLWVRECSCILH